MKGIRKLELLIPPPVVMLLCAALAWGIEQWLPAGQWTGEVHKTLALIFAAAGGVFGIVGVAQFLAVSTTIHPNKPEHASHLVTTGLYSISRNPMYLGLLLCLIAWCFWLGNWIALASAVLFVLYLNEFQIKPEEKILSDKFNENYNAYCKAVRRWI